MNVQDLKDYYRIPNNSQLSIFLGIGRTTSCTWEEVGIPIGVQAIFEIKTNGALKADRHLLAEVYSNKCHAA
ncbi:hypothetical protein [Acinetobacter haemolyticus]|uniref:hypothetical protein n=1 Tax=Acinetobacter haemolyticus TaxID=29430 RepID=UPI003AF740AC